MKFLFFYDFIFKPPTDKNFERRENLIKLEESKCVSYWISDKIIFCEPDRLSELNLELPRINYSRNGLKYRFVYGISQSDGFAEPEKV